MHNTGSFKSKLNEDKVTLEPYTARKIPSGEAFCRMYPQWETGEGIVMLYAKPNPFLLNKICLNQIYPQALFS